MTILHPKTAQSGDSDDPPPKKKAKKLKSSGRSQTPVHVASSITSTPGPSRRTEHRELYTYRSGNSTYFNAEPEPTYLQNSATSTPFFDQSDRVVFTFKLDKFDVGTPPKPTQPDPFSPYHSDFSAAGPSSHSAQVEKTQIYNPNCLEYYIYGPGWRNARNNAATGTLNRPAVKRPLPEFDQIEVLSSEDIQSQIVGDTNLRTAPPPTLPSTNNTFEGGSLLDDINNFDFDDKFGELEKFQQEAIWEDSKMHHLESRNVDVMINGFDKRGSTGNHHHQQEQHGASLYTPHQLRINTFRSPSFASATLSNLGNTCFLNSVLYTLRFAPNFLHNLHHLATDTNINCTTLGGNGSINNSSGIAKKTSSLGRNLSLMSWPRERDKDPSTRAGDLTSTIKTKKQIVTERLHEVYEAMRAAEGKENSDPFHPDVFLTALREVNPIFEGNQQQDAHELLVCLLDIFRETCQASARQAETRAAIHSNNIYGLQSHEHSLENGSKKPTKQWIPLRSKSFKPDTDGVRLKNEKNALFNTVAKLKIKRNFEEQGDCVPNVDEEEQLMPSNVRNMILEPPRIDNFVARDFEGVMVLRTTCLECGNTTEKREPFADICVPIKTDYNDDDDGERNEHPLNPSELYEKAVVTDEFLRDKNKYYCEECLRYNEARRSVRYQTLPGLLTLQLKRFSSTYGAMSKVTQFMPTPMTLACFCEDCRVPSTDPSTGSRGNVPRTSTALRPTAHGYELYGVIMHLGPNMAGGHYIAYVRMTDSAEHYKACTVQKSTNLTDNVVKSSSNNKFISIFKTKTNTSGNISGKMNLNTRKMCRGVDCCSVRCTTDPDLIAGYKYEPEPAWIACDDDNVKPLSASEVEDLLAKSSTSNATPYLLFYARRTDVL